MTTRDLGHGITMTIPTREDAEELDTTQRTALEILEATTVRGSLWRSCWSLIDTCTDPLALRIVSAATDSEEIRRACKARHREIAEGDPHLERKIQIDRNLATYRREQTTRGRGPRQ